MSIASAILSAQNKVAAAYSKCNDKGATMPAAADQNLSHLAATIDTISGGGGGGVTESDVNFWDYDGTLVAAYTAADFLALSALPSNPSHTGLTAQGWNWTLADAKTVVSQTGCLDIGAQYTITSGAKLVLNGWNINYPQQYPAVLWFYASASGTVDWGDSSTDSFSSGEVYLEHYYTDFGKYTVTVTSSGDIQTGDESTWGHIGSEDINRVVEEAWVAGLVDNGDYTSAAKHWMIAAGGLLPNGTAAKLLIIPKSSGGGYQVKTVADCSFEHISLSSDVASIDYIWNIAILPRLVVPSTVTAIDSILGVQDLYLLPTTPPTLSNDISVGTIYVPNGTLATYQAATNWSAYASQMVEM